MDLPYLRGSTVIGWPAAAGMVAAVVTGWALVKGDGPRLLRAARGRARAVRDLFAVVEAPPGTGEASGSVVFTGTALGRSDDGWVKVMVLEQQAAAAKADRRIAKLEARATEAERQGAEVGARLAALEAEREARERPEGHKWLLWLIGLAVAFGAVVDRVIEAAGRLVG